MHKVLPVFLLLLLAGCAGAQPYAALYNPPPPQSTPQPTQARYSAPTARAVCKVDALYALNLRSAPGTSAPVLGVLYRGDALTLTGNTGGAWWEVMTAAGVVGWINSNYCKGK